MVERCGYRRQTEISHSSFSSSLLDAIYRSIDQGDEEMVIYGEEGTRKKSCGANVRRGVFKSDEEMANFQRACMIEKWMEKKASEKAVGRRNSVADFQVKKLRKDRVSSSWSSSDSSAAAGFFSSSEAEAESFQVQRPKATTPPARRDWSDSLPSASSSMISWCGFLFFFVAGDRQHPPLFHHVLRHLVPQLFHHG